MVGEAENSHYIGMTRESKYRCGKAEKSYRQ